MPYICTECGNDEGFIGTEEVTEYNTNTCKFDRDGCSYDVVDTQYNNTDYNDSEVNECDDCNSENIIWVDEESKVTRIKELVELEIDSDEIQTRYHNGTLFNPVVNEITNWQKVLEN